MKKTPLFFLISIALLAHYFLTAQVTNDDCANAIDLGTIDWNQAGSCFDGTNGWDTMGWSNTAAAVPNFPYYSMTGCGGYTNATAVGANDVWFKFIGSDFILRLYGSQDLDTIHLNVWHGADCQHLNPVWCYTYVKQGYYYDQVDFHANSGTPYTYLQFSGSRLGETGVVSFCLQRSNIIAQTYYNTITVITNTPRNGANIRVIRQYPPMALPGQH